jgi:hypothetical protein
MTSSDFIRTGSLALDSAPAAGNVLINRANRELARVPPQRAIVLHAGLYHVQGLGVSLIVADRCRAFSVRPSSGSVKAIFANAQITPGKDRSAPQLVPFPFLLPRHRGAAVAGPAGPC